MPNTLTFNTTKTNTTKSVEYFHPSINAWQDNNVLTGVSAGTYTNLMARLKGSNPAIIATYNQPVTVFDPTSTGIGSARIFTLGQSNNVGSGSIQEFIANYASRVGATITEYTNVHIWNIKAQRWEKYNPQVNAQGFTGTSEDSTTGYDVGFCYFWGLAEWWKQNRSGNDHLFLEKSGGVNQAMHYFLASDGDGVNNAFHRVANTVWIPAENALPAYMQSLNANAVSSTLYLHNQGETEPSSSVPDFAANLHQLIDIDLAPYWPSSAPDAKYLVWMTKDKEDVNAQKRAYLATNPKGITSPYDQITVLTKDNVHWDTKSCWGAGYFYIPDAAGWSTKRDYWLFKCYADSVTNTIDIWYDEGGWFNDYTPESNSYKPAFTTETVSGKRAFTTGSGTKTKLINSLRVQGTDNTEKTLVFVVEQANSEVPQYVYNTNALGLIPGYKDGQVQIAANFIGSKQTSPSMDIFVIEYTRSSDTDSTGMGLGTVYKNGVQLGNAVPAPLTRVDGSGNGIGLFAPVDESVPLDYVSKIGTKLQFIGGYPEVSSRRRNAITTELTTLYNIGNTTPPVNPPTDTTVTEPSGPYSTVNFAPRATGIYVENNIWKFPVSTNEELTGLMTRNIQAGKSGRLSIQYIDNNAFGAFIGLNDINKRVRSGGTYSLFLNTVDGVVGIAYKGTGVSNTIPLIQGRHYAICRIGETGIVRIEQSTDNTGMSWTTIYTFLDKDTNALYGVMDLGQNSNSQLQNPRTQNMIETNAPLDNGGLLTLSPLGNLYSGGYADFGKSAITLGDTQAFSTWGVFNIKSIRDLENLLSIAATEDKDELFVIRLLNDGTIYSRVHNPSGGYSVLDDRPSIPLNTDIFILFEFDNSVARLFINGSLYTKSTNFALPNIDNLLNGLIVGGQKQANGRVEFGMSGSVKNVGFLNRLTTAAERTSLANSMSDISSLPSDIAGYSTLRRLYISDDIAVNTVTSNIPVIVLDGNGY